MMTVADYSVGDYVRHPHGHTGRVVAINPTRFGDIGAVVIWDADRERPNSRDWEGHYDDRWLRQHSLTKLPSTEDVN